MEFVLAPLIVHITTTTTATVARKAPPTITIISATVALQTSPIIIAISVTSALPVKPSGPTVQSIF